MVNLTTNRIHWTTTDIELFPEDGKRYEIINGELFVTRAPDWQHQRICVRLGGLLDAWSQETGDGEVAVAPGIIFAEADNVIPDLVWVRQERLNNMLDDAGHLTTAPELIVEVLSQSAQDQRRDRELKLKLYSSQGVQEYWIIDRFQNQIEIYRREQAQLQRVSTLLATDRLTSSLLPGFTCNVSQLFA
ncbi:MAG: Uma2 family endonuclease [Chloroflexi bacterium AL-N5]|nr:Uma2 family endonuclease [Chloroflexi bacterium AL-N5]